MDGNPMILRGGLPAPDGFLTRRPLGARFYTHPWKDAIVAGDFEQRVTTEHRGDGVGMAAFVQSCDELPRKIDVLHLAISPLPIAGAVVERHQREARWRSRKRRISGAISSSLSSSAKWPVSIKFNSASGRSRIGTRTVGRENRVILAPH